MISRLEIIKNKIIFISPLDWGMGHATRCVPIIELLRKHNHLILGVTALNVDYFNYHFPQLEKVDMPSYGIKYTRRIPIVLKVLLQLPRIFYVIKKEKRILDSIISLNRINLVISDNRYGCYSKQIESIFITHQLNLQLPFFSAWVNKLHHKFIRRFHEIWVPDFKNVEDRLSGKLSEDFPEIKNRVTYIEPLSALQNLDLPEQPNKIPLLILLSGPEPQRSILESNLLLNKSLQHKQVVLVRGCSKTNKNLKEGFIVFDFVFGKKLAELIAQADRVVCRSGYSTLMDLHLLRKKNLVLIPTPGQTEQEYLANFWQKKFQANLCLQSQAKNFEF